MSLKKFDLDFKTPSQWDIKNEILKKMTTQISKVEGSYSYDVASANAYEIAQLHIFLKDYYTELFPFTAKTDKFIDLWLEFFGLKRRNNVKATGVLDFTGNVATEIPIDSVAVSRTGIKYKTTELAFTDSLGKAKGIKAEADLGGVDGNCGIADINALDIAIPGILTVTNTVAFTGGQAIETIESCRERMREVASKPAHSGNANEYRMWAKSVSGVGRVLIVQAGESLTGGTALAPPGSVYVYISDQQNKGVNQALIDSVKTYIEHVRPVGADVKVESFVERPLDINIKVRINGTRTIQEIETDFENLLRIEFETEDFVAQNVISVAKIGRILLNLDGVSDYDNLTLDDDIISNPTNGNIIIDKNQTTILRNVVMSEWT